MEETKLKGSKSGRAGSQQNGEDRKRERWKRKWTEDALDQVEPPDSLELIRYLHERVQRERGFWIFLVPRDDVVEVHELEIVESTLWQSARRGQGMGAV